MKRHFDDDSEEPKTFVKIKPGARERARARNHTDTKPTRKTSYESSSAVQRWLREQAYEEQPTARPAFHPTWKRSHSLLLYGASFNGRAVPRGEDLSSAHVS